MWAADAHGYVISTVYTLQETKMVPEPAQVWGLWKTPGIQPWDTASSPIQLEGF